MATVERKVCDIDAREDEVVTVAMKVGRKSGEVDLCMRCLNSVKFAVVLDNLHQPRRTKQVQRRFTKTVLPPQPE